MVLQEQMELTAQLGLLVRKVPTVRRVLRVFKV